MSTETIAIVISAVGVLVALLGTFFGAFAWMIRRTDSQFERMDVKMDRIGDRISGVEHELVEVKLSIARLEGPPRHLLTAR